MLFKKKINILIEIYQLLALSIHVNIFNIYNIYRYIYIYIIYIYIYVYIYIFLHIYIYIYIYKEQITNNRANDGEKVNLFYIKFKIFILIIYKINKYLKSDLTNLV